MYKRFEQKNEHIPLQLYLLALKRLPLHNMAPVTGGVADGEEDQLVFLAGQAEGLLAPGEPVHGI